MLIVDDLPLIRRARSLRPDLRTLVVSRHDDTLYAERVLSDRELKVFELVGAGATTREIAERLHLSVKTVESYKTRIKNKLTLKSASELIRFAVHWVETD